MRKKQEKYLSHFGQQSMPLFRQNLKHFVFSNFKFLVAYDARNASVNFVKYFQAIWNAFNEKKTRELRE